MLSRVSQTCTLDSSRFPLPVHDAASHRFSEAEPLEGPLGSVHLRGVRAVIPVRHGGEVSICPP